MGQMSNEEAARILDPETSREALAPYAHDGHLLLAVTEEACTVAAKVLRQTAWVSVEDRLPEEKRRFIVRCERVGTSVGWILWGNWMTDIGPDAGNVTHWMPLPEPPKED